MTKDWQKLSQYQHCRNNTEMYFGSRDPYTQQVLEYTPEGPVIVETTWTPAVFTAFREILDNAIDELVAHGHGDRLDVTFDPAEMIFSVSDNGRGIPINWDEEEQEYAATVLLSHALTGRNFGDDRGETRGVNGIGGKGVNFCSEWFDLDIVRDGNNFEQRFREGADGDKNLTVDQPIIFPSDAHTGTKIKFKLSPKVFTNGLLLPESFVRSRIYEIALCYPSLKVFYNGEQMKIKNVETGLFPSSKPISFSIDTEGFSSKFWLMPAFTQDTVEFSYGLVNAIQMFNGGVHINAFKNGFYNGLLEALTRESKKRNLVPNKGDIADGLLIYNITQMTAPSFDSQSKNRLINDNVANIVRRKMDDQDFFKKVIKDNPDWIESIYTRCIARTQKQDLADLGKLQKAAKKKKVEGLNDACGLTRSSCVLFLTEGLSAVSGIVQDRNPEVHGALALKGKPMNAKNNPIKKVAQDETLQKIMNSVGLVLGQRVNRHLLRYGKIYITTDADEDGKNIAALLILFFYTFWPELFDPLKEPFIYVFDTPLIIGVKGKNRKYWYPDNYEQFDAEKMKGWEITRAKGLAALKRDDWKYVLANPKVMPIIDDAHLSDVLKLLFEEGPDMADFRKEMIGL